VLDLLIRSEDGLSATQLRESLSKDGQSRAGPKFYQLMKRLEKEGLVHAWSQSFDVGGGEVNRTYYRKTDRGDSLWQSTLEFYAARLGIATAVTRRKMKKRQSDRIT